MADDLGTDGLENQAKGAAKEASGKVRNAIGDLTDNHSEMDGKAQRKIGEAEEDIDRNT